VRTSSAPAKILGTENHAKVQDLERVLPAPLKDLGRLPPILKVSTNGLRPAVPPTLPDRLTSELPVIRALGNLVTFLETEQK